MIERRSNIEKFLRFAIARNKNKDTLPLSHPIKRIEEQDDLMVISSHMYCLSNQNVVKLLANVPLIYNKRRVDKNIPKYRGTVPF